MNAASAVLLFCSCIVLAAGAASSALSEYSLTACLNISSSLWVENVLPLRTQQGEACSTDCATEPGQALSACGRTHDA